MPKKQSRMSVVGHWVHSREEDTPTETVFRPSTFAFPLSRGRKGFELRPDGSMTDFGIGPTDRRQAAQGKWSLDEEGVLTLEAKDRRSLAIVSADKDKLVVRK